MIIQYVYFGIYLVKPYIMKHPENVSAVAGEDIRLGCVAGGKPQPELRYGFFSTSVEIHFWRI